MNCQKYIARCYRVYLHQWNENASFLSIFNGGARPKWRFSSFPRFWKNSSALNACNLAPTVFRWHKKMEFKFRFYFSFFFGLVKWNSISISIFRFLSTCDIEKRIWISFFVFRFRRTLKKEFETKNEKRSDAKTKNEIRSSKPFFKVRRKRKTKSKIQICFSMPCENEKWIWHLNSFFPCHRKTVGTKIHPLLWDLFIVFSKITH